MGRDEMDDRKRALVFGKFKFLYQDETEELEIQDKFQLATIQNKLLGPVKYTNKDGKSDEILEIYGQERAPGDGFSDPPITIPGVLDLFTVVWTNPFGDIFVDQDIKLFEFTDIQKYSSYNDGPKAKGFCQFHSSSASKELDGFDSSIFWSAGLLYKHFRTCGVEQWDIEIKELYSHYRNWKEWHSEVHNLPNKNNDKNGKFSNNRFSGPDFTSCNYTRPRNKARSSRRDSSPTPSSSLVNDPTKPQKHYPNYPKSMPAPLTSTPITVAPPALPYTPLTTPPPMLTIPPPGQSLTLPMMGPNGTTIQVQLMSLPQIAPPTPVSPEQQPRYNYINPNFSASAPPQDAKWSSAVEDFLHPKASTDSSTSVKNRTGSRDFVPSLSSSPKKNRNAERAEMLADLKALQKKRKAVDTQGRTSKKFKPKSQITAPTLPGLEDVNDLDILPEDKLYIGVIKDWKGKFGFIKCADIPGKIFLHSKDIKSGLERVGEAQKATFQVLHYERSAVGAKAVNVIILN